MKKDLVERFGRFHARFPLDDVYLGLPPAIRNDAYLYLLALNGNQRADEADGLMALGVAEQIARMMGLRSRRMLEALALFLDENGDPRVVELTETHVRIIKYAKWQDTPEEIAGLRAARKEAGRAGAIAGWEKKKGTQNATYKEDARPARGQQPSGKLPALAEQTSSKPPAKSQQSPAEREREKEKESLNAPPFPPTRQPDAVKNGYDDATTQLAVGMHEILGRQLSGVELIECQGALNQYAYLTGPELIDRAKDHQDYCKDHDLPAARTVGGFADSWRRENEHRADAGQAKAARVQLGRTAGSMTQVGDIAKGLVS